VDAVEKNTPRLVEVWQRIYADFPDWRLVIVGDGPAMGQIKEYISQHNTERVSLEGFQSNVQRYYERAAIVCLTSNFEGWPLAMIEGMQCGCVPFAFNTFGAAEEIIDHEQCGMVIEPDNIEQYAARLAEVMSDEPRRTAMAAAASEKSRRWSCDAIVEQWVALFESL
jgi:glycosyltransferase involved in cell wall biosynthesis